MQDRLAEASAEPFARRLVGIGTVGLLLCLLAYVAFIVYAMVGPGATSVPFRCFLYWFDGCTPPAAANWVGYLPIVVWVCAGLLIIGLLDRAAGRFVKYGLIGLLFCALFYMGFAAAVKNLTDATLPAECAFGPFKGCSPDKLAPSIRGLEVIVWVLCAVLVLGLVAGLVHRRYSLYRLYTRLRGFLFPIILVVLAQVAANVYGIHSDTLAAPNDIIEAAWEAVIDGTLLKAVGDTLQTALAGLAIGGGIGLFFSILLGLSRAASRLLTVSVEVLRPIPSVALIPVALLVFGFGFRMEVSIVAFACFWPVLIIGQAAIMGIEPRLIEVSRVLRLTVLARIYKIVLPAALPRLFVGFRLAAGLALIVAVTVEIAANPLGLGYTLMIAQQSLRPDLMFAMLLWVGIIGWGLNALLLFAQHRLFGRVGGVGIIAAAA